MDIVTTGLLALFAAAAAGGAIGFLVARLARFEVGLAVALMLFGVVALVFAARCYLEYHAFAHAGPNAAWGEVVAVEDLPVNASGSVTRPVPVVRFTAPDASTHVVRAPGSGGMAVGDHVNVVYDPRDPQRSRVGVVSELRGGAIALLLFGTFPASFGVWLLLFASGSSDACTAAGTKRVRARARSTQAPDRLVARRARLRGRIPLALNGALTCAILWIGLAPGELQQRFVAGFGAVAVVCVAYALWAARSEAGRAWQAGMVVLALNFGVWAFVLELLR